MYKADNELAEILLKHGIFDLTSDFDKKRGKRFFKTVKESHKVFCFDNGSIKILKSNTIIWHKYELTEEELKSLLFYFKATSDFYKEFYSGHFINFNEFQDRITALRKDLQDFNEHNIPLKKSRKKQQIIDYYDNITI